MKFKQQPVSPFLREPFSVSVLISGGSTSKIDRSCLSVYLVSDKVVLEGAVLGHSSCSGGLCTLQISLQNPALVHSKSPLRLCVQYRGDSVLSDPFRAIVYRIKLQPHNAQKFFKDKGGKNNYMCLQAKVLDEHNNPVSQKLDLSCKLRYNNGKDVDDQSILKYHFVDQSKGTFQVRYRIEQVSRAHCNKDFQVVVMSSNQTVSEVATEPITVLSKINKCSSIGQKTAAMQQATKTTSTKPRASRQRPSQQKPSNTVTALTPNTADTALPTTASVSELMGLCAAMRSSLKNLEWQACGYHTNSMTGAINFARKMYRCSGCGRLKSDPDPTIPSEIRPEKEHEESCPIYNNLRAYESLCGTSNSPTNPSPTSRANAEELEWPNTDKTKQDFGGVGNSKRKEREDTTNQFDFMSAPVKMRRISSWTRTITRKEEFDVGLPVGMTSELSIPSIPHSLSIPHPLNPANLANNALQDRWDFSSDNCIPPRPFTQSFSEMSHTSVTITPMGDEIFGEGSLPNSPSGQPTTAAQDPPPAVSV
jgi:hypothetical protein